MYVGWGEAAAFGTALGWSVSSYVHGIVGRMVGAPAVTLLRMPYQLTLLGLTCLVLGVDMRSTPMAYGLLFLSGLTGISMSDFILYRAILTLGPQTSVLLLSTSAGFTALFGWVFLGEILPFQVLFGIGVTFFGIFYVLTEHSGSTLLPGQEIPQGKVLAYGIGMVLIAAMLQAASFIFLKVAMQDGMDPVGAAFLRLLLAAIVLWGLGLWRGWTRAAIRGVAEQPRVALILLGASAFSAGGMWCSSLAMALAPAGVAATIIGLQPVLITFVGAAWQRKKPSARVLVGTVIAFVGTALVCLR